MDHEEVIWQVIRHNHCSFMANRVFCLTRLSKKMQMRDKRQSTESVKSIA
ncbi:hypothetical protein Patl1_13381 [Pistacia atlantica]|uniref:Uncharacterized protein n=1 Tax=Pistacia atlantica TaxID=434234 RepID=A0ACC1AV12_9ROSI|nr:hypothetical protein Patl1_13381 [Pistacia atlantica]